MNHENCPLTKEQLGNSTWNLLHTMAVHYPDAPSLEQQEDMAQFFKLIGRLYPCGMCARDFTRLMTIRPPVTCCRASLSEWLCWAHNKVNEKLGKPLFDVTKVNERWKDGWKDGSCD